MLVEKLDDVIQGVWPQLVPAVQEAHELTRCGGQDSARGGVGAPILADSDEPYSVVPCGGLLQDGRDRDLARAGVRNAQLPLVVNLRANRVYRRAEVHRVRLVNGHDEAHLRAVR